MNMVEQRRTFPLARDAAVIELPVLRQVGLFVDHLHGEIGERGADLAAADVTVGDRHDGRLAPPEIVQSDLVVRSQHVPQKCHQRTVLPDLLRRHGMHFPSARRR
jgi:hypothetical protein